MQKKTFIRLFLIAFLVCSCLVIVAYSHQQPVTDNKESVDDNKGDHKKVQSEFIFWESLSRNMFGICN